MRERNRRLVLASASSSVAHALSTVGTLITIPLVIRHLGPERFGMWVTLTSVMAILTFVDLGLGNGLLTAVAEANGRNDRGAARGYVSGSFFSLLGLALVLGATFAVAYPHIRWELLLNVVTPTATAEAGPAVAVTLTCFLATMPLGLAQKIYMGYQEGAIAAGWGAAGMLLGLSGVVMGVQLDVSLTWLLVAFGGGPVASALAGSLHLFLVRRPWLRPRATAITRPATRYVLGTGAMFFVLGLAGAIGYQSDALVIAQLLGASEVGNYAVPAKMFFIVPTFIGLGLAPLWPAYREAMIRRDPTWVRRSFNRSMKLTILVGGALILALVILGPSFIRLWTGEAILVSPGLLLSLALWSFVWILSLPVAMLLNGLNAVRFQVIAASAMALSNILISMLLVSAIGVAGAPLGSVIAQVLCVLIPSTVYLRRVFQSGDLETSAEQSDHAVTGRRQIAIGDPARG